MPSCATAPAAAVVALASGNWDSSRGWDAIPPTDEELWRLDPDFDCGPPDGDDTWAMDVPADLLCLPRDSGRGAGFAAGGPADSMPPGVTLAELASGAWAAGLDRLTDDQLIGVLRAWRRLTSWTAAGELPPSPNSTAAAPTRSPRVRTPTWPSTWATSSPSR